MMIGLNRCGAGYESLGEADGAAVIAAELMKG